MGERLTLLFFYGPLVWYSFSDPPEEEELPFVELPPGADVLPFVEFPPGAEMLPFVELPLGADVLPFVELPPGPEILPFAELPPGAEMLPFVELPPGPEVLPFAELPPGAEVLPFVELLPGPETPLLHVDPIASEDPSPPGLPVVTVVVPVVLFIFELLLFATEPPSMPVVSFWQTPDLSNV